MKSRKDDADKSSLANNYNCYNYIYSSNLELYEKNLDP